MNLHYKHRQDLKVKGIMFLLKKEKETNENIKEHNPNWLLIHDHP